MIKILVVCGAGLGSSLACQMATQQAMDELGVEAKVTHTDTNSAGALSKTVDILVAAKNFQKLIEGKQLEIPTVFLERLVNKQEITEKLTPVLRELGVLK